MAKVKIISAKNSLDLEHDINKWLEANQNISIQNINYSVNYYEREVQRGEVQVFSNYSAMVFYTS